MKLYVALPTDHVDLGTEFVSAEGVAAVARAAEAAGFDGVYSTEHPFPDDDWLASGGHQALDPFVGLSFAAAATTRLRVLTNLCVLPYRNPFLAARAAASLDVLSGGRLDLGVGAGYLEGEFRALGVDFDGRNDRFDEAIAAITAAWSGESVRFAGDGFEARGNTMRPAPLQRPRPPVWVGGWQLCSCAATRRSLR
jgi:probable F420-dependent oxidoreductase